MRKIKRLTLRRETIATLTPRQLRAARGGLDGNSGEVECNTTGNHPSCQTCVTCRSVCRTDCTSCVWMPGD